jgi:hypothetical protein
MQGDIYDVSKAWWRTGTAIEGGGHERRVAPDHAGIQGLGRGGARGIGEHQGGRRRQRARRRRSRRLGAGSSARRLVVWRAAGRALLEQQPNYTLAVLRSR